MLRYLKKQGFTLIELMVVIVIIGVLASLAIPRFTEASVKAKVAEAPRIIASYESAYLTAVSESGTVANESDLVFTSPTSKDSKWWTYTFTSSAAVYTATANSDQMKKSGSLVTTYSSDAFVHSGTGDLYSKKYVPNFMPKQP